jgi:hypothetical protein
MLIRSCCSRQHCASISPLPSPVFLLRPLREHMISQFFFSFIVRCRSSSLLSTKSSSINMLAYQLMKAKPVNTKKTSVIALRFASVTPVSTSGDVSSSFSIGIKSIASFTSARRAKDVEAAQVTIDDSQSVSRDGFIARYRMAKKGSWAMERSTGNPRTHPSSNNLTS